MNEDEPFLRVIRANPDDRVARLVYADWLDDRGDPRAEYVRLEVRVSQLPLDNEERPSLRRRMIELQGMLPSWWLTLVGGFRATATAPDPVRIETAALALGRRPKHTDATGYEWEIHAAALCGRTGAVAYLESRSKWRGNCQDISYLLRLRDPAGRATSWEPETYNPYFGCDVQFLEWYGDAVILIYREKHRTYLARVGFDSRPDYQAIADDWIVDGSEVASRGWREPGIQRFSIPDLKSLSPLSEAEAVARDLLLPAPSE